MGHLPWFEKQWSTPGVSDSVTHRPLPSEQNMKKKKISGLHPIPTATDYLLLKPSFLGDSDVQWNLETHLDPNPVMSYKANRSKEASRFFKVTLLISSEANSGDPCQLYSWVVFFTYIKTTHAHLWSSVPQLYSMVTLTAVSPMPSTVPGVGGDKEEPQKCMSNHFEN